MGREVQSAVFLGDTHSGSKLSVCPPRVGIDWDCGFEPSSAQLWLWSQWQEMQEWIPWATHGEPYVLVHGGDIVEGVHHRSTSTITNEFKIQRRLAVELMAPLVDKAAAYFQVAGTPCHDGEGWTDADEVARELGACQPEGSGLYVHPELVLRLGDAVVQDTHHIGVSGMHRTQQTAINSEVMEQLVDAALDGHDAPSVVVRHHSHHAHVAARYYRDGMWGYGIKCPSWQLKGPFPWKVGSRNMTPHYGAFAVNWITEPWGGGRIEVVPFTRSVGKRSPVAVTVVQKGR